MIILSGNQNDSSLFLILLLLGLFPFEPICFLGTSRTSSIWKVGKKEVNVISYFLMAIEWHPCVCLNSTRFLI